MRREVTDMKELSELYDFAGKSGVRVDSFRLSGCKSLSLCDDDGGCFIAMDPFCPTTCAEERVRLAHELGHCLAGAFYDQSSTVCDRRRAEHRADVFAIRLLIKPDELCKALKGGTTQIWELAELFNVTEEFMSKAVEYYESNG